LDIVFGFNPAAVFFLLEFLLQQVRLAFWSHAVLSCHSRRWPEPFSCSRAQIARGPVLLFRFFFVCVCRWFSSILSPAHIWNHQQLMPPSIFSSPVRHLSFSSRSPEQDRCAPPGLGPGLFFFLLPASVYAGLVLRFHRYLSLLPIISPCSSTVECTQCCVLPRPSVLARRFASHGTGRTSFQHCLL
jgi:hypothetical protein